MRSVNVLMIGLAAVSVCMAAINGRVTDASSAAAISGAVVRLEKGGQVDTTDASGNFTIATSSMSISSSVNQSSPRFFSATLHGSLLQVNVAKRCAVSITVFTLNGTALSTVQQTMAAGNNTISLPHRGAGVYLYRIKAGSNEVVLQGSTIGESSQGRSVEGDLSMTSTNLAKQAKAAAAINDVIAVKKKGYLNYRMIMKTPDTTGIAVKMIVCADTVVDADGNVYQAVRIGNQVWTVENLRTTKFNDKTAIPKDTSKATWPYDTTAKYCFYGNTADADTIRKFGALYNWYAVNTKKLAPAGWHVADTADWNALENYLVVNGYNWDGTKAENKIAKSMAARVDWLPYTAAGTIGKDLTMNNSSGFSALGGGYRDDNGTFLSMGNLGCWWSSTEVDAVLAYYRGLGNDREDIIKFDDYYDGSYKSRGFSVRLLKNN